MANSSKSYPVLPTKHLPTINDPSRATTVPFGPTTSNPGVNLALVPGDQASSRRVPSGSIVHAVCGSSGEP